MAKLSQDKTYVTVESGDTLSAIALTYLKDASKYKQLATINGISNPNYISVGQKIYLSSKPSSGSTTTTNKTTTSNCVKIDNFGLQSNADNVIFATWTWSKANTEHYEYKWQYATGDGIWFVGTDGTTKDKQCTYNIPQNATRIRFNVKPISKKYTKNNKETSYWTANWAAWKLFDGKFIPPEKPGTPSVTIEGLKLTATLDNITSDATKIEFEIIKDDKTVFISGKYSTVSVTKAHASYSCNVTAGGKYKARCRSFKNSLIKSDWSEYSNSYDTPPTTPSKILVLKATGSDSVYIDWENASNVKTYTLEWTTNKSYFDTSTNVQSQSGIDASVAGRYNVTNLETGKQYFFRVRAENGDLKSGWSEIKSITLGRAPSAPSTWSSTTTVIAGEELKLYWIHNSEDGSSQTYAELEITKSGHTDTYTIKNSTDEYEKDKTSEYVLDTSAYASGEKIEWRVRTAGVLIDSENKPVYGEWSVVRTANIYFTPEHSLTVSDKYGSTLSIITSFPFYIVGITEQSNQTPVSYHVSIVANEAYETIDNTGNKQLINNGDIVYTKDVDTSGDIMIEMSPGNVNLENGVSYTCASMVAMSSGLTASSSVDFTVSWTDQEYEPNAEISIDSDTITAQIRPYCEKGTLSYRIVASDASGYVVTEEELDYIYGDEVENVVTATGEQVYTGMNQNGDVIHYCIIENHTLVENILLSVYRREFDGEFTEIATNLVNTDYTTVTDPHPALDYARYRIVATDLTTGAISYADVPGVPVGEKSAIIQWDEEWSTFDVTNEDALEQPAWTGSLLKLTGNLDVSDSNDKDVELIEYIGRKHPVKYSGTHLGEKQTWNVDISKDDTDTLYALRRLKSWLGDVYVREPSGSGFWATVDVSFSKKHREVTIPVTINITRVEGGM